MVFTLLEKNIIFFLIFSLMGYCINIRRMLGPAVTQQPPGPRHRTEGSPQSLGPTRCRPAAPGTDTGKTRNSAAQCTRCLTEGPSPSH